MEVDSRHLLGSFQSPIIGGIGAQGGYSHLGNKQGGKLDVYSAGGFGVIDILVLWQIFICRGPPQLATITTTTTTTTIGIGWERRLAGSVPESTQFYLPGTWRMIQDTHM